MRALASHQCGPSSIPGPSVICELSLLLPGEGEGGGGGGVLSVLQGFFFPGSPVFVPPQKPTRPNSNSIRNTRLHKLIALNTTVSK